MGGDDNADTPSALDGLSLQPLESDQEETSVEPEQPKSTKAQFKLDTRGKSDRRISADRRQTVRFEKDRRSGVDRRPQPKGW